MTDPWTDAVAVYDENGDLVEDYIGVPHADADALLAAVRAYRALDEYTDYELPPPFQKSCAQCDYKEDDGHWRDCPWAEIEEALASLPEHLK